MNRLWMLATPLLASLFFMMARSEMRPDPSFEAASSPPSSSASLALGFPVDSYATLSSLMEKAGLKRFWYDRLGFASVTVEAALTLLALLAFLAIVLGFLASALLKQGKFSSFINILLASCGGFLGLVAWLRHPHGAATEDWTGAGLAILLGALACLALAVAGQILKNKSPRPVAGKAARYDREAEGQPRGAPPVVSYRPDQDKKPPV